METAIFEAMPPARRPSLLSLWDLAALAGLAALAAWYDFVLPRLPDPVPIHFDALGRANGWAPKAQLAYVVLGIPVAAWLVLLAVDAATFLVPRTGGMRRSTQAFRGLLGLGLTFLMAACLAVPLAGSRALFAGLAVLAACLGTAVVLLVRDTRATLAALPRSPSADPEHYRWGVFYVNPEDPRLWVEKRIGLGWTLNYARPAALWITLLLILPALVGLAAALGRIRF